MWACGFLGGYCMGLLGIALMIRAYNITIDTLRQRRIQDIEEQLFQDLKELHGTQGEAKDKTIN